MPEIEILSFCGGALHLLMEAPQIPGRVAGGWGLSILKPIPPILIPI